MASMASIYCQDLTRLPILVSLGLVELITRTWPSIITRLPPNLQKARTLSRRDMCLKAPRPQGPKSLNIPLFALCMNRSRPRCYLHPRTGKILSLARMMGLYMLEPFQQTPPCTFDGMPLPM